MLMKNASETDITISDLGLKVRAGQCTEIADAYCAPRLSPTGTKLKSIIEMLAPQLVPAQAELVDKWKARTLDLEAPTPPGKSAADYMADGVSPAVAAMVADGQSDSVSKVNKTIPVQPKTSTPTK